MMFLKLSHMADAEFIRVTSMNVGWPQMAAKSLTKLQT